MVEYKQTFTDEEKIKAFDMLAEHFYNQNFGTMTKSEIELLMFNFYMKALIRVKTDENNVLNYVAASDYEISKVLGIPQTTVRNLKIKNQARYRVEFDWKKSLFKIKENIRYDEPSKKFIIPVTDPNLNFEIRNYINSNGGYVEFESGNDHIKIRTEYFLMLMYYTLGEEDREKWEQVYRKQLKKDIKEQRKREGDLEPLDKRELLQNMIEIAGCETETILNIVSAVSTTNPLAAIISSSLKVASILLKKKAGRDGSQ